MIYFDNSSTTLMKPPEVAEAVSYAIQHFGNASRSFYEAVMRANREVFKTRMEIAELIGLDDPLNVAFSSSATESLNLVIGGLVKENDSVITTVTEHNSVLRPLYLKNCPLDFIDCDDQGVLLLDQVEQLIKPTTRFFVCTHGSNVTGNITDVKKIYNICKANHIIMILDISQTFGLIPVRADMADVFCFTGHKGLYGPQGTGGIILSQKLDIDIVKTGGAGVNSFKHLQPKEMPDLFEVGTLNSHSIYGLQKGVEFIKRVGLERIHEKEMRLCRAFYEKVKHLEGVNIYGDFSGHDRLPIVSLNIEGFTSSELALILWEKHGIATRAGSHCAPLLHKRMNTVDIGMVRFSFSYFNTEEEIEIAAAAIENIIKSR